jgi:hypothetical protein
MYLKVCRCQYCEILRPDIKTNFNRLLFRCCGFVSSRVMVEPWRSINQNLFGVLWVATCSFISTLTSHYIVVCIADISSLSMIYSYISSRYIEISVVVTWLMCIAGMIFVFCLFISSFVHSFRAWTYIQNGDVHGEKREVYIHFTHKMQPS